MKRRIGGAVLATAILALLTGCASSDTSEGSGSEAAPAAEHPKATEHPKGAEHPKGTEHPKSEHPK